MRGADTRSIMRALRAWLDEGDERNARRIAEYVIERAIAGHSGFVKLLFDMVDGKLHQTAEDTKVAEPPNTLTSVDDCATDGGLEAA
jgi:hypothetical protein